MAELKFNISEIFYSLQGEAKYSGLPTVFIRLVGCPLRCSYCDSEYAFYGNNILTFAQILDKLKEFDTPYICITGGEPLAHKECPQLITRLIELGYNISLETSGALSIADVHPECHIVMDIKTPSSTEMDKNLLENLPLLKASDEVKFVIGDYEDFLWSKNFLTEYAITNPIFSPTANTLSPTTLAEWILAEGIIVRMQTQLHKALWGDVAGK